MAVITKQLAGSAALALSLSLIPQALGESRIGYLTLEGAYVERQQMAGGLVAGSGETTLRDLIATLDAVAADDSLEGLVVRLRDPELGQTQIEEMGRAMDRVRDAGKPIHVFAENYSTGGILIGCNADEIILQQGGSVSVPGIYMQEMFLADALRWAGVEPDFVQIGDYKGAKEMMGEAAPTPAWEQNISQLLDSIYGSLENAIAKGRNMSPAKVEKALEECFWADGRRAIAAGLIDTELDRLDLEHHLAERYGEDIKFDDDIWTTSGPETPDLASMGMFEAFGSVMRMISQGPGRKTTRDTIAILHIDGAIIDGESKGGGLFGGAGSVGSVTIREALKEIQDDKNIKGLIVRINSPGGSATASEMIWQGLGRVRDAGKPVWVSVGTLAASGGYYIAVGGEKIYMNPTSIVGSIGVVGGKLATAGLYEKFHVNVVPRARGPHAGMLGSLNPWTDAQRALIHGRMTETYDLFASRVTEGRSGIDLSETAEGRLFVGEKAISRRMADEIGGIDDAISDLASDLGLALGAYDALDYPAPLSFEELIEQMFGGNVRANVQVSPLAAAARELLGEQEYEQLSAALNAALQLRNRPVALVMPRVLIWSW